MHCDSESLQVGVKKCHCLTYSEEFQEVFLSSCMYNCKLKSQSVMFYKIPQNVSLLNQVCGIYNREGVGCSHCMKGYGIAVYSYDYFCVKCEDYKLNWLKYIAVAYLPVTTLYLLALGGRITLINNVLFGYVLFGQLVSTPIIAQLVGFRRLHAYPSQKYSMSYRVFFLLYGIWNLDFGRSFYEPFCLHPSLSEFHSLILDFIVAIYPLFLVVVTYFIVQLHDSYKFASDIFKPARALFRAFKKEMSIKASLVDVFVTFIVLSNVKLLHISFSMISVPVSLVNKVGFCIEAKFLYLNESMEYMGKEHRPYLILGLSIAILCSVLPILLLCFYPLSCFKKLLVLFRLNILTIYPFMEALQGHYKSKPRDYRWFSTLPFLLIVFNYISFYITIRLYYFTLMGFILAIYSFVVMCFRPYQASKMNVVFSLLCLNSSLLSFYNSQQRKFPKINIPHHFTSLRKLNIIFTSVPTLVIVMVALIRVVKCFRPKFGRKNTELSNSENDPLLRGHTISMDRAVVD